jgi:TPR repeat protein
VRQPLGRFFPQLATITALFLVAACSNHDFADAEKLIAQKDYAHALPLITAAATAGNRDAQGELGALYREGIGVPLDYSRAVLWLSKAAAQGNARAQFGLGKIYYNGLGVDVDYKKALPKITRTPPTCWA